MLYLSTTVDRCCIVIWPKSIYSYSPTYFSMDMLLVPPEGPPTSFPCVDCGLMTGNFCDGGFIYPDGITVNFDTCFAAERVPQEYTDRGGYGRQRTPLCTYCETFFHFCRFCRGVKGCTPPPRRRHWSGVKSGRQFDAEQFRLATLNEFSAREKLRADRAHQAQRDTPVSKRSRMQKNDLFGQDNVSSPTPSPP